MSELINKIKGVKGIGYIAVGLTAALVLLLWPSGSQSDGSALPTADEYREMVEAQTTELIRSLTGLKGVAVQITLESGYEYTFASDKYVTENTAGTTTTRDTKTEIFASGDGSAVITKQKPPAVAGVAVVCKGADAEQRLKIISLLTALYDIGSNRISVQT